MRKGDNRMKTCKWIRRADDNFYQTACGKIQRISVRPNQKICFCGKRIERVTVDTVSKEFKDFILKMSNI